MLAGMWVNTMVRTSPMRAATFTLNREEKADTMPAAKNTDPRVVIDRPNLCSTQRAKIACVAKPPPSASRLNRADRRSTIRRDPGLRARSPGSARVRAAADSLR